MDLYSEYSFFILSFILFVGILMTKPNNRLNLPVLLVFIFVGMLFGVDGFGITFDNISFVQIIGTIALNIILFSGGMETKIKEITPILKPGITLSTIGVLLTTFLTGLFIYFISKGTPLDIHLSLLMSMLLAATMSSTDSASVFNILRSQNIGLKHNLRPMLELESGSNDPMAYMLTILLVQVVSTASLDVSEIFITLLLQFAVGTIAGLALGYLIYYLIKHINLDNESLYPILVLSIIFLVYIIADLCKGNGYLAVYIAGIILGNKRIQHRRDIMSFMNGTTWLFQILMFLFLGLLVNPHEMLDIWLIALFIGLFMIVIARPLSVFICLLPFRKINFKSQLFVSWVGLRGAVPIILATYPIIAEIEGARQLFNIVFFITLISLLVQGTTIPFMARLLRVDDKIVSDKNSFNIELPETINATLKEIVLTEEMLAHHTKLKDMSIPHGHLIILVERDEEHIIPNGQLELFPGDKLLIIQDNKPKNR